MAALNGKRVETLNSSDRVFTNSDVSNNFADALVFKPDICHQAVVIEIPLAFHNYNPTPNYEYFFFTVNMLWGILVCHLALCIYCEINTTK